MSSHLHLLSDKSTDFFCSFSHIQAAYIINFRPFTFILSSAFVYHVDNRFLCENLLSSLLGLRQKQIIMRKNCCTSGLDLCVRKWVFPCKANQFIDWCSERTLWLIFAGLDGFRSIPFRLDCVKNSWSGTDKFFCFSFTIYLAESGDWIVISRLHE